MATREVTLDRVQRVALRDEIEVCASEFGDVPIGIRCGKREDVVALQAKLGHLIHALDAIGWSEQPDAPDAQSIRLTPPLVAWAKGQAEAVGYACAHEIEPQDRDLDVFTALCAMSATVATGRDS